MARTRIAIERRYADLDTYGHVNNVETLVYLQEARVRLLVEMASGGAEFEHQVVARQEIDYLAPIPFGLEPITVETWIDRIGTSSYVIAYEIHVPEVGVAARAKSVQVWWDPTSGRSRPISDEHRALLAEFLDEPEAAS